MFRRRKSTGRRHEFLAVRAARKTPPGGRLVYSFTMFEDLRRAFKEAVNNFQQELGRDSVADTVDELLKRMEREAVDAKTSLAEAGEQLQRARARAKAEEKEEAVCRRREAMARKIGDAETADVAAEFAAKHAERKDVMARKAEALEAEMRLQEAEYAGMVAKIKEARANRDTLAARAGRAKARESLDGVSEMLDGLDEMGTSATSAAAGPTAEEFDDEILRRSRDEAIDERLEALKRRMGRK